MDTSETCHSDLGPVSPRGFFGEFLLVAVLSGDGAVGCLHPGQQRHRERERGRGEAGADEERAVEALACAAITAARSPPPEAMRSSILVKAMVEMIATPSAPPASWLG